MRSLAASAASAASAALDLLTTAAPSAADRRNDLDPDLDLDLDLNRVLDLSIVLHPEWHNVVAKADARRLQAAKSPVASHVGAAELRVRRAHVRTAVLPGRRLSGRLR
ncbi:unnamed protein product [Protopolystoma xenopodis]|uniref:Uncharacterized protein n=1 Tax=Protopolystoma xenopodis TaxID=117903 RepID=A0A3S5CTS7_9PLAT|nr:unnamed protein product [Protopolystoma xenopodis]